MPMVMQRLVIQRLKRVERLKRKMTARRRRRPAKRAAAVLNVLQLLKSSERVTGGDIY